MLDYDDGVLFAVIAGYLYRANMPCPPASGQTQTRTFMRPPPHSIFDARSGCPWSRPMNTEGVSKRQTASLSWHSRQAWPIIRAGRLALASVVRPIERGFCLSDDDDPVTIIRYRSSTMMDCIADMALRHGDRRARAYDRSEPVIRCIQDAITAYRRDGGDRDGRPTITS